MTSITKHLSAAIFAALWLSGCAAGSRVSPANLEDGLTGETPNHVVVAISKSTHLLRYRDGSDEPDASSISDLNAFLNDANAVRGVTVLIERGGASGDDDRTVILSGALTRRGLRPVVRVAALPPGELRLTIERYEASAPNCPNWSKTPGNDFANTLPSDFGCATAANLAAMIADPKDLIVGSDLTPASGDAAVAPVQRYRTDRVKPMTDDGASSPSPHGSAPAGAVGP